MSEPLKLENIHHGFKQGGRVLEVLRGVSLTLKAGRITALLGVSGSGKSTLLNIAGLLESPNKGRVTVVGGRTDSERRKTELRRKNIGFIHQFHHLLADLTALENLALPLMIKGKSKRAATKTAMLMLAKLGMENRADHLPGGLSGGECQRVAVARALVAEPKLILADEPTGNLDEANAKLVFTEFTAQAKRQNTAVLMVTHDKRLSGLCDEVLNLGNGRIN